MKGGRECQVVGEGLSNKTGFEQRSAEVMEQIMQMFWEENSRQRQPGKGSGVGKCLEYSRHSKEAKWEWSRME